VLTLTTVHQRKEDFAAVSPCAAISWEGFGMCKGRFDWIPMIAALVFISCCFLTVGLAGGGVDAARVFEQLKELQGTWRGEARELTGPKGTVQEGQGFPVNHEFRVSAAGSVVMEIMGPGTGHEMINMFHLDGPDLVLTHYCAEGNQPSMRLNRVGSSDNTLKFDFAGGTNLDPAVDQHIHSSEIVFTEDGGLESIWRAYTMGKQSGIMKFTLHREGR